MVNDARFSYMWLVSLSSHSFCGNGHLFFAIVPLFVCLYKNKIILKFIYFRHFNETTKKCCCSDNHTLNKTNAICSWGIENTMPKYFNLMAWIRSFGLWRNLKKIQWDNAIYLRSILCVAVSNMRFTSLHAKENLRYFYFASFKQLQIHLAVYNFVFIHFMHWFFRSFSMQQRNRSQHWTVLVSTDILHIKERAINSTTVWMACSIWLSVRLV